MQRAISIILFILVLGVGCAKLGEMDVENSQTENTKVVTVEGNPAVYFEKTVVPVLNKQAVCASCHSLPKDGGIGNLDPYSYMVMRDLLTAGTVANARSTIDNGVINYMQGFLPNHAGGRVFCTAAMATSPCKELREWGKQEGLKVVDPTTFGTAAPYGRVYGAELDGTIWGWAQDPDTLTSPMPVEIHIDGARGVGVDLVDTLANRPFSTVEKRGNVGFRFALPDAYRDGVPHQVFVYGVDTANAGNVYPLAGSPITVTAYLPTVAAQTYYEANVLPIIQSRTCTNCHSISEFGYSSTYYYQFLNPPPHLGGTASNNIIYRKMLGTLSHRGGAHCGGNPTAGLCGALINTWNLEFN